MSEATKTAAAKGALAAHAKKTAKPKEVKTPVNCWCGCKGQTRGKFVPGHDARFHGNAKRVARGLLDGDTTVAGLEHDEARIEFARHVAEAAKTADAWNAAEKEKVRRREEKAKKKEEEATPPAEAVIVEALQEALAGGVSDTDVTPEEVETLLNSVTDAEYDREAATEAEVG